LPFPAGERLRVPVGQAVQTVQPQEFLQARSRRSASPAASGSPPAASHGREQSSATLRMCS
jgi:hypothetical protein